MGINASTIHCTRYDVAISHYYHITMGNLLSKRKRRHLIFDIYLVPNLLHENEVITNTFL